MKHFSVHFSYYQQNVSVIGAETLINWIQKSNDVDNDRISCLAAVIKHKVFLVISFNLKRQIFFFKRMCASGVLAKHHHVLCAL